MKVNNTKLMTHNNKGENNMKKEMTLQEIQNALGYEIKIVADKPSKQLLDIPVGETFKLGDLEFIVLEHQNGYTNVILKEFWKEDVFDSNTNNYANSNIRKELNRDFYNKLASLVGKDDIVLHTTDLTSDDGRNDYDKVEDYVSLLTCDMYRKYVYVLDKYRPKSWWWLATPYSTESNGYVAFVRIVRDVGTLNGYYCDYNDGVRPFCIFKSSIFVS